MKTVLSAKQEARQRAIGMRRMAILMRFAEENEEQLNKHLNMQKWFDHTVGELEKKHKKGDEVKSSALFSCNTKACMLGTAAMIPALRKAGLRVFLWKGDHSALMISMVGMKGEPTRPSDGNNHEHSIDTAASFFKLPRGLAKQLFFDAEAIKTQTVKDWLKLANHALREAGYEVPVI